MESSGYFPHGQKEKVVNFIQSIGNILRDQKEFQRTIEVFDEALQMHIAMSALHQHPNGYIGISGTIYEMGVLHLQMEEWTMYLVLFMVKSVCSARDSC